MKQLTYPLFAILSLAGASVSVLSAAPVVIDDFDSYSDMIQAQNPSWTRGGSAVPEGIYSDPAGGGGREAVIFYDWSEGNRGFVRYTFSEPLALESGVEFSVDLRVSHNFVPGTTVSFALASAGTTYETAPQALTNTDYQTFSFLITEATAELSDGPSVSLSEVLANLSTVSIWFRNSGGAGYPGFAFDNLSYTTAPIPEPSAAALGLGLVAVGAFAARRRRAA